MAITPVRNANRMMASAELSGYGIEIGFTDGAKGTIPYSEIPELKVRSGAIAIDLSKPYELRVETVRGEVTEIPWDFARHYCDVSYRPAMEEAASQGRAVLGDRIRRYRLSIGRTQQRLAREANIGRVTVVRMEKGEQSPRFETLSAIARALEINHAELLVEPRSIGD